MQRDNGTLALAVWIAVVGVGAGLSGVRAFGSGGCDAPCLCCLVFGPGSKPSCSPASGECTCNGCSCRTTPGGSNCGGEASAPPPPPPPAPAPAPISKSIDFYINALDRVEDFLVGNNSRHWANTTYVRVHVRVHDHVRVRIWVRAHVLFNSSPHPFPSSPFFFLSFFSLFLLLTYTRTRAHPSFDFNGRVDIHHVTRSVYQCCNGFYLGADGKMAVNTTNENGNQWASGRSKQPSLATKNLLEDTDRLRRPP